MFLFDIKRIIQDYVSKMLQGLGAAAVGGGWATNDEWTAISGGIIALVGIAWNAYQNRDTRKNIAINTTALEEQQQPSKVAAASKAGTKDVALPTDKAPAKPPNFGRGR